MPTWESQYFALQSPPSDNVAILLHHAAPRRMRLPRPHGLAMTRMFLKSRHSEEAFMPTWESQYFALQSPPSDNVAILLHHAAPRRMRLPRPHGLAMTRMFLKSRHSEEAFMPTWESQYFALQSPPSDNVAILLHHAAPRRMRLPRPHGLAMTRIFFRARNDPLFLICHKKTHNSIFFLYN